MLNVLRFAGVDDNYSVLSERGREVINNTRELCFLTQVVIRVFEDTNRPIEDPKRFRVEILFSPGATATPLHINEASRNADTTRFDTAPLEVIGRDDLTCKEIEEFFGSIIFDGDKNGNDHFSIASTSSVRYTNPKVSHVKDDDKAKLPPQVSEGPKEDVMLG